MDPYIVSGVSACIREEIQRFESVHPSIYAIYDYLELIPDRILASQIRDHVVCIEGKNKTLKVVDDLGLEIVQPTCLSGLASSYFNLFENRCSRTCGIGVSS
jgi:Arf-GAP/GTPase/ANK repeat/PH domain-containing protein 1/3